MEPIWALASLPGIVVLLEESVVAFTVFKFVGAAYLGYLGLRSLLASFWGNKRAGQSRFGTRVRDIVQGVTGVVLLGLGLRLTFG